MVKVDSWLARIILGYTTPTWVNCLHKGRIIDVSSGWISKHATEELEILRSNIQGQEMQNALKLSRSDYSTVGSALKAKSRPVFLKDSSRVPQ